MERTLAVLMGAALAAAPAATAGGPGVPHGTDGARSVSAPVDEGAGDLDLAGAVRLAVAGSPRLAAASREVREAEARALQAGLPPNPSLRVETENVAGSGAFAGAGEAETTVTLSQLFELGGKRARRHRAAVLDRDLAARDHESARLDVRLAAVTAFVDVLAAQEQVVLAEEGVALAEEVVRTVRARVRAGSSSRVELTKAEVALGTARLERETQARALRTARQRLAATWGGTEPRFARAVGSLASVGPPPAFADLRDRLADNPDLARWRTEVRRWEALVAVERRRALPDVTLGAGYRRLAGPDENAVVAEMSLPLPAFDRNQGAVLEARHRAARARDEWRATEVQLVAALSAAYEALATAEAESRALEASILPGARETFETLRAGYREGRFGYLDVLDAQRTLAAARARRVSALADYHRALATVERLTGGTRAAAPGGARRGREHAR
jgi:cobalt-zinc-cadmium efflux system outer membrane protein